MIVTIHDKTKPLSAILAEQGTPMDLRCGGRGTCGRCGVALLAGVWQSGAECLRAPASALACRVRLLSAEGVVDVPDNALAPVSGVVLNDWQDVPSFEGLPADGAVAIGIDIGTTTLAAVALRGGEVVARASRYNPQSVFGDNVISRISASSEHLAELRQVLLDALRSMLSAFPTPMRIAISGNSTMTCLFHGVSPEAMGAHPFAVPQTEFPPISGECLGFPDARILTVPLISAFLGGDILAGLGETRPAPGELFVDIGTNCEMVAALPDGNFSGTAAAAGPAFEGAGLTCGSRAIPGAICEYAGPGKIRTIGACAAPTGCCGSALVDFLSVERRAGRLGRFGQFEPAADRRELAPELAVTAQDIEQLLKAKGAVFGGLKSLEQTCGSPAKRLILAGGFARFLNLEHAVAIGMLPERPMRVVGNTALAGALRLAAAPHYMQVLNDIRRRVREIPLNTIDSFEDNFIDGMQLP